MTSSQWSMWPFASAALLSYHGVEGEKNQARLAHENGDASSVVMVLSKPWARS